mmetsp:Transcript_9059/g.24345  ORF Transcript_9059/g.24345 Transcript_9059/m.24345 type:complete len:231 (-) Transcript_9059:391-1083(-)
MKCLLSSVSGCSGPSNLPYRAYCLELYFSAMLYFPAASITFVALLHALAALRAVASSWAALVLASRDKACCASCSALATSASLMPRESCVWPMSAAISARIRTRSLSRDAAALLTSSPSNSCFKSGILYANISSPAGPFAFTVCQISKRHHIRVSVFPSSSRQNKVVLALRTTLARWEISSSCSSPLSSYLFWLMAQMSSHTKESGSCCSLCATTSTSMAKRQDHVWEIK